MTQEILQMTRFVIAAAAALLVLTSCSSGDEAPPDSSQLAAIEAALCEQYGPIGSMPLDGKIYDMSDCP